MPAAGGVAVGLLEADYDDVLTPIEPRCRAEVFPSALQTAS